ncbi:MAG: T9SS type A sorting domain-containing protein [Aquabacterium sp.]|nr:T9SS type A sorting domain-containing protein [Ferruginibacter sp.]
MKKILIVISIAICFSAAEAQQFTGTLLAADAAFNRPEEGVPPAALSIYTNVRYHVIPITLTAPSLMTFSSSSVFDNFMVLYNPAGFSPSSPLSNALVANDDMNSSNAGFSYNVAVSGTYYLVFTSFKNNTYGAYTVTATLGAVLPVKLTSFTAIKSNVNSNIIKWAGIEEVNIKSYQVQRSTDNKTFTQLEGNTIAAKNFAASTTYSFTDARPAAGYNYYRLMITEGTGRITYSPVALVKNSRLGVANISLYPNPAADYIQLEAKPMQNVKANIAIINSNGDVMLSNQKKFNNLGVLLVDITRLTAGKYFIKTTVEKDESIMMFIKY